MLEAFPITDVRNNFLPLIERIVDESFRFMVTKHGKPVAVVISYEEYSRMTETLRLMEDSKTTLHIRQGSSEAERGDLIALTDSGEDIE